MSAAMINTAAPAPAPIPALAPVLREFSLAGDVSIGAAAVLGDPPVTADVLLNTMRVDTGVAAGAPPPLTRGAERFLN